MLRRQHFRAASETTPRNTSLQLNNGVKVGDSHHNPARVIAGEGIPRIISLVVSPSLIADRSLVADDPLARVLPNPNPTSHQLRARRETFPDTIRKKKKKTKRTECSLPRDKTRDLLSKGGGVNVLLTRIIGRRKIKERKDVDTCSFLSLSLS